MSFHRLIRVRRLVRRAQNQGVAEAAINAAMRANRSLGVSSIEDLSERIRQAQDNREFPPPANPLDTLRNYDQ